MKTISGSVVAAYQIPPYDPDPVAEAHAAFDELGNRHGARLGEIEDAEPAVEQAKAADHKRLLAAINAGKELPADPTKHETAATAKLTALRATLPALEQALDEAGNHLAQTIADGADEWIDSLEPRADDALERYHAHITAAREALSDFGRDNSSMSWLRSFDADQARVGRIGPWHGKAAPVTALDRRQREHRVDHLLEIAARVGAPPPRRDQPAPARRRFPTPA